MVAPETDRRNADAHEQFTFLEGLLDTFEEPALLTAGTGPFGQPVILYSNAAAEQHLGRTFDRLAGQPINDLQTPEHRAALAATGLGELIDVSQWEMAPLYDRKGGHRYRVYINTSALLNEGRLTRA